MDRDTLDHQLFTWEGWDENGPCDLQYYDVTLVTQIGEFPVGTTFPTAFWMGELSMLVLVDKDEKEHAYELKVSVGEKLELPKHEHTDKCGCGHEHKH